MSVHQGRPHHLRVARAASRSPWCKGCGRDCGRDAGKDGLMVEYGLSVGPVGLGGLPRAAGATLVELGDALWRDRLYYCVACERFQRWTPVADGCAFSDCDGGLNDLYAHDGMRLPSWWPKVAPMPGVRLPVSLLGREEADAVEVGFRAAVGKWIDGWRPGAAGFYGPRVEGARSAPDDSPFTNRWESGLESSDERR